MKIPPEIDKAFREGKSHETYKTYTIMLSKMFREVWGSEEFSVAKLKEVDKVKKYIDKGTLSITSRKIITIAAVMILKAAKAPQSLIDVYGKLARDYRIKDTKMRKDRAPTSRERGSMLDWPDIIAVRECYKKCLKDKACVAEMTSLEYRRWYMKYVTLCLFTMIPPQRGQVFYNCYIDIDVKGSNMIDTKKSLLIVKHEKTTKSYGVRRIVLPTALNSIIKDWKEVVAEDGYLLMPNAKGNMMSSPAWTQFMNSIFQRDMSTDMLRKIYVSYMITEKGISIDERQKLADIMGHSVLMQQHSYFKGDWN